MLKETVIVSLSSRQYEKLFSALCTHFDRLELTYLSRVRLGYKLNEVTSDQANLRKIVAEMINFAERRSEIDKLVEAAANNRPNVSIIQQLAQELAMETEDENEDRFHQSITSNNAKQRAKQTYRNLTYPFLVATDDNLLVGRDLLLATITQAVKASPKRIVLYGMVGVGKTALALKLAHALEAHFPDGILWADLSNATPETLPQLQMELLYSFASNFNHDVGLLQTLNVRSRHVMGVLASKDVLIVLDGASDASAIYPLLPPNSSNCVVIITTQHNSIINSSQLFNVPLLSIEASMKLLVNVIGNKRIMRESDATAVLLNRLEGHPQALTIVARSIRDTPDITIQETVDSLNQAHGRLESLTDWDSTTMTLQASFELSFGRLTYDQQHLLVSLANLPISEFESNVIAYIMNLDVAVVKRRLARLHILSLLSMTESTQTRYRLHSTLRSIAAAKAQSFDFDQHLLEARTVEYYSTFCQRHTVNYAMLAMHWDNIRQIIENQIAYNNIQIVTTFLSALTAVNIGVMGFLDAQGHWKLAQSWLTWSDKNGAYNKNQKLHLSLLWKRGAFALRLTDHVTARRDLVAASNALQNPETFSERIEYAHLAEHLARLEMSINVNKAIQQTQAGLDALAGLEDDAARFQRGNLHVVRSTIYGEMLSDFAQAEREITKAFSLLPNIPSPAGLSAQVNQTTIAVYTGNLHKARLSGQNGIVIAKALGDRRRLGLLHMNLGVAEQRLGDLDSAEQHMLAANEQFQEIGAMKLRGGTLVNLGRIYSTRQANERAKATIEEAIQVANAADSPRETVTAQLAMVEHLLRLNSPQEAALYLEQVEILICDGSIHEVQSPLATSRAEYLRLHQELDQALVHANNAIDLANSYGFVQQAGNAALTKGKILAALGQLDEAEAAYRTSVALLEGQDRYQFALSQQTLAQFLEYRFGRRTLETQGLHDSASQMFSRLNVALV